MEIDVFTLFPEAFDWFVSQRHVANAVALGHELNRVNYRDHTPLSGRQVDDMPFGGGAGMVLRVDVVEAALRALEIKADIILKATKVAGVYTADPMIDTTAELFNEISYRQVLERQLKVMDASAISLCMDNNLPIIIFNMREPGNIRRVVTGERGVGTKVG